MRWGAEVTAGGAEAWTVASAPVQVKVMTSWNAAVPVEDSDWTKEELANQRYVAADSYL